MWAWTYVWVWVSMRGRICGCGCSTMKSGSVLFVDWTNCFGVETLPATLPDDLILSLCCLFLNLLRCMHTCGVIINLPV